MGHLSKAKRGARTALAMPKAAPAAAAPSAAAGPLTEVTLTIQYNFATDTITALACSAPTAGAHLLQRILGRAQTHVFIMTVGSYETLLAQLQEKNTNGQN